jgi:[ribosomal protein S5]-alanine N-acetyltransferase
VILVGMGMKIKLRKMLLSDAKRFFEILSHPEFYYYPAKPVSIKQERGFLRKIIKSRKEGLIHSFAIIINEKNIGGAGFTVDKKFPYRCMIGYFIDRKFWNKGIATEAVKLLEDFITKNQDMVRIEIITAKKNTASQRVAIKSGYKKEGLLRKYLKIRDKFHDCCIYSKILK